MIGCLGPSTAIIVTVRASESASTASAGALDEEASGSVCEEVESPAAGAGVVVVVVAGAVVAALSFPSVDISTGVAAGIDSGCIGASNCCCCCDCEIGTSTGSDADVAVVEVVVGGCADSVAGAVAVPVAGDDAGSVVAMGDDVDAIVAIGIWDLSPATMFDGFGQLVKRAIRDVSGSAAPCTGTNSSETRVNATTMKPQ